MLDKIKNAKLSPLVFLLVVATAVLNSANSAQGETTNPTPFSTETFGFKEKTNPSDEPGSGVRASLHRDAQSRFIAGERSAKADERITLPDAIAPQPFPAEESEESLDLPEAIFQAQEPAPEAENDSQAQEPDPAPENDSQAQEPPPAPSPDTPTVPAPPETDDSEQETPPPPAPSPDTPAPDTPEEPTAEEARVLVGEVVVSGADRELTDLVYNTIRTRPGRVATRSQLQEDINAIYGTGYFANVRVTPEDTPLGVRITFAVQPNPVLQRVQIQTVPETEKPRVLPDKVIEETFAGQYGRILNLRELQEGIKKLNEWYAQNGYDLAQVIESPQVSEDGTVTLVIAEGVIENIEVRYFDEEDEPAEGNTRPFIVTREMELKPGDVFNRNTAQRDLQRVFGLGIFEDARLSFSPGQDPRRVVVNVDIVEGNTGSLAAGAGISSNSGIFGTASYQEQNLGGNNQTLGVELQIGERDQLFDASFSDPWIGGDPYRTSYTVNAFRRRSISLVFDGDDTRVVTERGGDSPRVVRTGGGITFTRPIAENPYTRPDWRLSAGFTYQRVQIENGDGEIAPRSRIEDGLRDLAFSPSGKDDLFIFSFNATQDSRNNALQPTSGSVLRLGVEQSVPIGSGSILLNRLRASYSYYIPVDFVDFGFTEEELPQTIAFNAQAGTVLGDLPPYEAFVIGGSSSVRGYGEGEVGVGRSFFQLSAEYRFPILSFIGGALFVDYGTTIGSSGGVPGAPGEERGLPGSGLGYGVGVRVQSPVGPIRIDYGWNDQGESQLHFGIGERF